MRLKYSLGCTALSILFRAAGAANLWAKEPVLINIKELAPGIQIEMRYASTNNFTGKKLYPVEECLLCEPAAQRLAQVQKNLEKKGLGLKIWDCYRPLSIQKKLWSIVPDPRYVADPKTGSRHNRGASVDLTLVNNRGEELPMPTGFDEFCERAHRDYDHLSPEIKANRLLLQSEMEKAGFIGLPTEWWHFDSPEWNAYALRDDPLGSSTLSKDIPSPSTFSVPLTSHQLIVVLAENWSSKKGFLQRYEKSKEKWKKVGNPWDVNLGAQGLSWAVHSPTFTSGPGKREGDLTAPAGLFKIGKAYGYANRPPAESRWPYQPLSNGWVCVDDSHSRFYNQILSPEETTKKDWDSCEAMRRNDHLYEWVINIDQNPTRAQGRGSCIFMHVRRRADAPTEGCTAMEKTKIVSLLKWLDPAKEPVLLQLPNEIYQAIRKDAGLP